MTIITNTLCVFGTRPEAIKMAPLIKRLNASPLINNKICVTGQHKHMLDSVLELFDITPDYDLEIMTKNQSLSSITAKTLIGMESVFKQYKPNLVLVHGDTTTTLTASLSSYYHKINIAHVEAGLRTGNINSPWPEEANRKLTGGLAHLHFAPTETARINLLNEDILPEFIHVTGNTVIDALSEMSKKIDLDSVLRSKLQKEFSYTSAGQKMILVTGHRRENFGDGFERICHALIKIAKAFPAVNIVYPVHLNPAVQEPVHRLLSGLKNIFLIPPVDYISFIYLMKCSYLILTDSGGIQEEAPSLGKPVLVMRETTERPEAIHAGTAQLIGTDVEKILTEVSQLLVDDYRYSRMAEAKNPYGDGHASDRIVKIITRLNEKNSVSNQSNSIDRKFDKIC